MIRMPPLKPLSKEEAIALARGPYATTVEIAVAASIAPFLWRELDEKSALKIRNGTGFFVSPDRPFMITADHVYAAYLDARNKFGDFARCQLGICRSSRRVGLSRGASLLSQVVPSVIEDQRLARASREKRC